MTTTYGDLQEAIDANAEAITGLLDEQELIQQEYDLLVTDIGDLEDLLQDHEHARGGESDDSGVEGGNTGGEESGGEDDDIIIPTSNEPSGAHGTGVLNTITYQPTSNRVARGLLAEKASETFE